MKFVIFTTTALLLGFIVTNIAEILGLNFVATIFTVSISGVCFGWNFERIYAIFTNK